MITGLGNNGLASSAWLSGQTFGFLDKITVSIVAEGLEEVIVAELDEIPDTIGDELDLEVTNTDLQEYIKKDEFNLRVETVTDETISKDVDIDIHSVFFVNAKILGI